MNVHATKHFVRSNQRVAIEERAKVHSVEQPVSLITQQFDHRQLWFF